MAKPRLRLMSVADCYPGQRAWSMVKRRPYTVMCEPITIVAISKKRYEALFHFGHEFNISARKFWKRGYAKVWAVVG